LFINIIRRIAHWFEVFNLQFQWLGNWWNVNFFVVNLKLVFANLSANLRYSSIYSLMIGSNVSAQTPVQVVASSPTLIPFKQTNKTTHINQGSTPRPLSSITADKWGYPIWSTILVDLFVKLHALQSSQQVFQTSYKATLLINKPAYLTNIWLIWIPVDFFTKQISWRISRSTYLEYRQLYTARWPSRLVPIHRNICRQDIPRDLLQVAAVSPSLVASAIFLVEENWKILVRLKMPVRYDTSVR
jgi:hypothetical protein